ncbi:peroxisomal membrane protein 11B [Scaptodrosophila lebanonensis]|uniref:Peroxisomal membrane protein 11B n=1 Tax=Drosophila lebanonensis TaxID=7225 RepID=A0A6J2UJI5_DROLE|nr:peroxisomal membrane protein 11B [Scaptodrosophila lebanonensis]
MDKWVQLNNQAAGRDKIARLVQYASRAIWDSLESSSTSPALVDNFKTIEYILSTFRKLLRLGKSLDVFYATLRTIHYPDLAIRVTLTMSKLSQALFLVADHFLWLARTGLVKINAKKWSEVANKYWLFSIIMNLCRDFYEIMRALDLHRASCNSGISRRKLPAKLNSPSDFKRLALQSYVLMLGHKDIVVDTVKNLCDFFIPLTALGYTKMTPRTIGLLGAISSLAGLWALLEPEAKLTPA